jgi:hypothetical protein
MADNDPFEQYKVAPAAQPADTGGDPFAAYKLNAPPASAPASLPKAAPVAAPSEAPDPFQAYKTSGPGIPSDVNKDETPWYKKAWDVANTPLTTYLGIPEHREGAGGFERGVENILSGFTSPLSIGLTLATFGTGGLIESAGATALKEAGLSAVEIAQASKGAEVALEASKAGQNITNALTSAGIDPGAFRAAQGILYDQGLRETDLIGGNLLERGGFQALRRVGMDISQAQTASKTAQTLMNAGFTAQQLHTAVEMSPRFLDALKEGDYDHAAEYGTEALAGTILGGLGASHVLQTAGEMYDTATGKLRPSDENVKLEKLFNINQGEHEKANQNARLNEEQSMKDLGFKIPVQNPFLSKESIDAQNLTLAKMYHGITLDNNREAAAQYYNAISEAAGRDERLNTINGPRGKAEDWMDLEDKVSSLLGRDYSKINEYDLEKAGASKELQKQWGEYLGKTTPPESSLEEVAEHSRAYPIPAVGTLAPGLIINTFAHEALSRMPVFENDRQWLGVQLDRAQVLDTIDSLNALAAQQGTERFKFLADNLANALGDKNELVIMKRSNSLSEYLTHEQVHAWNRLGKADAAQAAEVKKNRSYSLAAMSLKLRGYANRYVPEEIGTHLASGDYLGLPASRAASLLQDYLKPFTAEQLANFPGNDKIVKEALKGLGHDENLNSGAITRVLEQQAQAARRLPASVPTNIRELIQYAVESKTIADKPKQYVDRLLDTYKAVYDQDYSDAQKSVMQNLRDKLSEGLEQAQNSGVIQQGVKDYMTRRWKTDEDNPAVNQVFHDANNGRFSLSASQARHRIFGTELEALLKGKEYATENPVALTSQWIADVYKAISNRSLIENLRRSFVRGSDGRPAVVLAGTGKVVEGPEGENPATLVSPQRVSDITINGRVITKLAATGELQRFLENGNIVDLTPKAHFDNFDKLLSLLERKKASAQAKDDPLTYNHFLNQIYNLTEIKNGKNPYIDLDKERVSDFKKLADAQRGEPEEAMRHIQHHTLGPGVISFVAEHLGDLTHRMSEKFDLLQGQHGIVADKVQKVLEKLKDEAAFKTEARKNIQHNYEFYKADAEKKGETPKDLARLKTELNSRMLRYAEAHEKLFAYNAVQALARDAAVSFGRGDFKGSALKLSKLNDILKNGADEWKQKAGEYEPDPNAPKPTKQQLLAAWNADQKPVYVWRPQDYITVNNGAFRGWNFVVNDPGGNPVFTEADVRVHPEFAQVLKNRLGIDDREGSPMNWAPTRAIMKANAAAKRNLLSFSPFHQMQETLRALMTGISPVMKAAPTIENSSILRRMVNNHLTLEPDYRAIAEHSEGVSGHSKLLNKVPIIGRSLDWYEDFLFRRYIPNLKARAAEVMYQRYTDAHPDWTPDKVAQFASAHVNDTFGGQNWRAMGRSAATQDWARLMLLAPDWLESELRSAARLFSPESGVGRAQIAKMTLGLWGAARVLNLVTTGRPHLEAPFGLAVKDKDGKETVYSMRTLPTDLLHAATDPVGFMKGRLSPLVRAGEEAYSGRDQFGRKLAPGDLYSDIYHNMAPIPFQAIGQAATNPTTNTPDQIVKALGGTATQYHTQAEKLAADLASNHTEDGPVDQNAIHRHQVILNLEDEVRSGKLSLQELQPLRASGQLSEADWKRILNNYQKTRGMEADKARLYTRASRAPAADLLQIYDAATEDEKQTLLPLLKAQGTRYIRSSLKDKTASERMADPVLARYMKLEAKQASQPPTTGQ